MIWRVCQNHFIDFDTPPYFQYYICDEKENRIYYTDDCMPRGVCTGIGF